MNNLIFNPIVPWPLLLPVAVMMVALIGWSLFRGLRSPRRVALLWTLRTIALAAVIIMFLQPQLRTDEVITLRPQLAVVVDATESMTDPVDEAQPRRADRVREWLKSPAFTKLKREFDVRLFTFDQTITEQSDINFTGERSNVRGALQQVQDRFLGQPLAGILFFSDGLDHNSGIAKSLEGEAPAEPRLALRSTSPVFTFELENEFKPQPDRAKLVTVAGVDFPQRAVVGWETEVRVTLAGQGLAGQTVGIELWRDDQRRNDATVAFTEDDQTCDATFVIANDRPGIAQYELRVTDPSADKEARSYPFLIEVIERGNRVLYLQNALGFDFKFLRKALTSDRNLQLVSFVRWADNRLVNLDDRGINQRAGALEFTQDALAKYSVVMLGDLPHDALTGADYLALREFVDRGGALVLLGGANGVAPPLGELMPVQMGQGAEYREGNFPVEITETGLRHPVFGPLFAKVQDFPPLLTINVPAGTSATAEVLMQTVVNGRRVPLIAAQRFGQGRVVVVLTDTIWRWRLAAKSWASERSPYDTFWAQLMDWLIPKEQDKGQRNRLELFSERTQYVLGEKPELRAILNLESPDAKPPGTLALQLRTPDNRNFEYTLRAASLPGRAGRVVPGYRVEVEPPVAGLYTVTATSPLAGTNIEAQLKFIVTRPVTELTGKPINRELLKSIGKFYPHDRWNDWRKDLTYEEQYFSRVQLSDLWNNPLLWAIALCALAADWLCRKLWSLP